MTPKQLVRKMEALKAKQAQLRDEMRELASELEDHFANADEACDALESAAEAVSRLL